MALLSNSSVSDWLQFNGTSAPLAGCQYVNYTGHLLYLEDGGALLESLPEISNASCAQVCNDSASLFDPGTNNLATCGLWSTLLSTYTSSGPNNSIVHNENPDSADLFEQFQDVGLSTDLLEYATSYADIISTCFQLLYFNAKFFTYADDGRTVQACTREVLFPLGSNTNSSTPVTSALQECLGAICSPITLNPDLAGIGVISSFLVQSAICIVALLALLSQEWLALYWNKKRSLHAALVAALVDFHKIQCFFASTIQITALILFREAHQNSALNADANSVRGTFQDFFDTSILVVLATSGIIPISLTLACISRYGRQSWYLLTLSAVTMILATATLACAFIYAQNYGIPYDVYSSNMENPYLYNDNKYNLMNASSTTCSIRGSVGYTLYPLCGSWDLANNALGSSIFTNYWIWLVWANCILWLPFCVAKHWSRDQGNFTRSNSWGLDVIARSRSWSFDVISREDTGFGRLCNELGTCRTWSFLSCVTWSLCFGGQFYLFSIYFQHSLISQQWSFGQIIAVTVWVPTVVEYCYIEYNGVIEASKYRYPAPLRLTDADECSRESLTTPLQPRPLAEGKSETSSQFELTRMDSDMSYMSAYRQRGL